nr:hypothetical protein [bacterium]
MPEDALEGSVMGIRQQLEALSERCVSLCGKEGWLGIDGTPNYRLLYSSVDSFEQGSGFAIVGMNPAGGPRDAHPDHADRPFREPAYSAYLDDRWNAEAGAARLQRVIQAIATVLAGASACEAMAAIEDPTPRPEERLSLEAMGVLRNTPSMNIIPFRASRLADVPLALRERGEEIGWRLLCLARPRLRCIVTLANQVDGVPWRTILRESGQRRQPDYQETINKRLSRTYREVQLVRGELAGTLVVGLPAIVRDKDRCDVTMRLLNVLHRRLQHHGIQGPH